MIRRPLNLRFNQSVLEGRKTTTIRDTAWPIGLPIMLYNWSGLPYRSPQIDVACIVVQDVWTIWIQHEPDGTIRYSRFQLWETEGFSSQEEMDAWFRPTVPCGDYAKKQLMRFTLHPLTK